MGHVVIRRKRNVVGTETPYVSLFRCIQNMNPNYPYNTCYTGGEPVLLFMSSYAHPFYNSCYRRSDSVFFSQARVCVCVCGDWLHTDLTVTFPSPQVLWSWRSGTTWSWWSLAPRPACPWPETPPSWALSSSLKVCHVTGDPRDAFAKRTVQQGAVVVTSTDFGCCEKNTGSSRVCTGWTTDWVSFSLRGL